MINLTFTKKSYVLITIATMCLLFITMIIFSSINNDCTDYTKVYSTKSNAELITYSFDSEVKCNGTYTVYLREEVDSSNEEPQYIDVVAGEEKITAVIENGQKTTSINLGNRPVVIDVTKGDILAINFLNMDTKQELVLEYKD